MRMDLTGSRFTSEKSEFCSGIESRTCKAQRKSMPFSLWRASMCWIDKASDSIIISYISTSFMLGCCCCPSFDIFVSLRSCKLGESHVQVWMSSVRLESKIPIFCVKFLRANSIPFMSTKKISLESYHDSLIHRAGLGPKFHNLK